MPSWTDLTAATALFQTGDVFGEANFKTYVLDNLKFLGLGARVTHSAAQTIVTATGSGLAFNTERYDPDGFHDNVTNNSRLTVPAGCGGRYLIIGNVSWTPNATGARQVNVTLNGATVLASSLDRAVSAATALDQIVVCTYILAAAD